MGWGSKRKNIFTAILMMVMIFAVPVVVNAANKNSGISVSLNKTKVQLYTSGSSKSYQLKAAVVGSKNKVKWTTSDKAIATVSKKGKITAKKAGRVNITATVGTEKATCQVTVVKPSTKLDKKTVTMNSTAKLKLKATVKGSSKKVKWKTNNKSVATVDSNGMVTAKKAGTVTISATANGKTAKCVITVMNASISLNKSSATLDTEESRTITLKASVKGADTKVTWKSSDKSVATVNSKGKVTAKKEGTATISATANGKTAKCKITVQKKNSVDVNALYKNFLQKSSVYIPEMRLTLNLNTSFLAIDLNNDGIKELLIRDPVYMAGGAVQVYTVINGKISYAGYISFVDDTPLVNSKYGGIYTYVVSNSVAVEQFYLHTIKDGKIYQSVNLRKYQRENGMEHFSRTTVISKTEYDKILKKYKENLETRDCFRKNNAANRKLVFG